MGLYRDLIRPALFRLDAEAVHRATVAACRVAGAVPGVGALLRSRLAVDAPELTIAAAGLTFPGPVGLAAGWDKSGRAVPLLMSLGPGFVEIGSVSADPSAGNPRPRLARLPADRAIVVNYGLPNDGADAVAARLARHARHAGATGRDRPCPLGVNLVATNRGPAAPPATEDEILDDYATSAARLAPHADYLMLNLACPNTADGPDAFARPGRLGRLLARLADLELPVPVFLKVPADDDPATQDRWLAEADPFPFVKGFGFNLPPGKPEDLALATPRAVWARLPGAVAGRPFAARADRAIAGLYARMDRSRYVIFGGGGVFTAEDAYHKVRLGATLVPIYTALVYEGPSVIRRLHEGLLERLRRDGLATLADAVGTASTT